MPGGKMQLKSGSFHLQNMTLNAQVTAPYDKGAKSSEEQRTCEPPIQSPVEVTVCGENNETTGLGPPSTIIDNNYYMLLFLSTIRHAECYRYARNINVKNGGFG